MILLLQTLSTACILLCAVLLIAGFLRPIRLTRGWFILGAVLALSIAFWGYCLIPNSDLDLYRLQERVDLIRNSSDSVFDIIFSTDYTALIGFNILCYIVSLLPNNNWLSFLGVLITFLLIFSVLIDYLRSAGMNSKAMLPSLLVVFMGMPIHNVFSGIRNGLAISLALVGLYLFFYKKKHKVLAVFLLLLSPTIHPATLILLPAIFVSRAKGQMFWRIFGLAALPVIFLLANQLASIPVTFINYIGRRILFYSESSYMYDRPEMIANMLVFISTGGAYWLLRRDGYLPPQTDGEKRHADAYYFLGFAMLGCTFQRDFALRIGYLMGFAAIPILCRIFFRPWKKPVTRNSALVLVLLVLCILACCAKVYYDIFYVMSQWEFM